MGRFAVLENKHAYEAVTYCANQNDITQALIWSHFEFCAPGWRPHVRNRFINGKSFQEDWGWEEVRKARALEGKLKDVVMFKLQTESISTAPPFYWWYPNEETSLPLSFCLSHTHSHPNTTLYACGDVCISGTTKNIIIPLLDQNQDKFSPVFNFWQQTHGCLENSNSWAYVSTVETVACFYPVHCFFHA